MKLIDKVKENCKPFYNRKISKLQLNRKRWVYWFIFEAAMCIFFVVMAIIFITISTDLIFISEENITLKTLLVYNGAQTFILISLIFYTVYLKNMEETVKLRELKDLQIYLRKQFEGDLEK